MRLSLIIGLLFISTLSFSQNIEASVAAFGIGNYSNNSSDSRTEFGAASYSPML